MMVLVKTTITLNNGQEVAFFADDMLNAMWKADSQYHGNAREMHFETVEVIEKNGGETNVHAEDHRQ